MNVGSLISVEYIKRVHEKAILSGIPDEKKLIGVVRDEGTLYHIAYISNTITDIIDRASYLLFSISNHHPFVEGNKRTAVLLAELILGEEYAIDVSAEELNTTVRKIASAGDVECTRRWLMRNIKKID